MSKRCRLRVIEYELDMIKCRLDVMAVDIARIAEGITQLLAALPKPVTGIEVVPSPPVAR